jgi:hypothetical protein
LPLPSAATSIRLVKAPAGEVEPSKLETKAPVSSKRSTRLLPASATRRSPLAGSIASWEAKLPTCPAPAPLAGLV